MVYIFGIAAIASTFLGGLFAMRSQDKLHLILGFSAGAVIGVAFFDLFPEAIELVGSSYSTRDVTTLMAAGFLGFMVLSRFIHFHPGHDHEEGNHAAGHLGAAGLTFHSFLDGLGIGLAFLVSNAVGLVVAVAVLAHDFSDGINTVSYILKNKGKDSHAFNWLIADSLAPVVGIFAAQYLSIPDTSLGLLLAVFCGFFLYIGASDLLPESQCHHSQWMPSLMTILGAGFIYLAVQLAS